MVRTGLLPSSFVCVACSACFDQVNLGALACLEVAARRLIPIVDAHKQGAAPSCVNAKYLTPLPETDEILAPGLRAHLWRRARENLDLMQSAKKADAAAAITDFTTYDDDEEMAENRADVSARDKGRPRFPQGSVPRPLRADAKPSRGGDPLELADNWIPCSHFPSLLVNVISSLFSVARLPRV